MSNPNINTEITNLLAKVRELAGIVPTTKTELAFLGPVADSADAALPQVELTEDELAGSENSEEWETLGNELENYTRQLRKAWGYKLEPSEDFPDWLKSLHKTDADYYAGVFVELPNVDGEFLAWFENENAVALTTMQTKHTRWQDLRAKLEASKSAYRKTQKAIDLRALLIGSLRMTGMPQSQIQSLAAGEN